MPPMANRLLQTLLTSVTMLHVCSISNSRFNRGAGDDTHTWKHAAVPLVVERRTVPLSQPDFHATLKHSFKQTHSEKPLCGIQCQQRLPVPTRTQLESLLAYETVYANGSRTLTEIRLSNANNILNPPSFTWSNNASSTYARSPLRLQGTNDDIMADMKATLSNTTTSVYAGLSRPRQRRQVFGADGRFVISDQRFTASFPFSASVKLSSGCSGILVAPRHVLTAAHCVHDGREYLKESRDLRVGVMRSRTSTHSSKGGWKRGGARGAGGQERERKHEEVDSTQVRTNITELSKKNGEPKKGRGKRRREKARVRRRTTAATTTGALTGVSAPADPDPDKVSFRWARVKQIHTPRGWMKALPPQRAPEYDYAVLELRRRPQEATPMELGLLQAGVKQAAPAGRIHFTGFDHDQPGKAVYRFCSVSQESSDLLYQYCDAQAGSSGAGVYVRLLEPALGGPDDRGKGGAGRGVRGKWTRKVIGVFSGHQWVDDNGTRKDYNVAVRITPAKYAQICHWIYADSKRCSQP